MVPIKVGLLLLVIPSFLRPFFLTIKPNFVNIFYSLSGQLIDLNGRTVSKVLALMEDVG